MQAMMAAGVPLMAEREDKHHLGLSECDPRGRFVFGFVREPLSWYKSQYNYRRLKRFNDGGFPGDQWLDLEFPEFLNKMIEHHPAHVSWLYKTFLGPPDDNTVQFVGRTESLADDVVKALELAGEEFREDDLRAWKPANLSGPSPVMSSPPPELLRSESEAYERFYPHVLASADQRSA
jgi:hypothetical protein